MGMGTLLAMIVRRNYGSGAGLETMIGTMVSAKVFDELVAKFRSRRAA